MSSQKKVSHVEVASTNPFPVNGPVSASDRANPVPDIEVLSVPAPATVVTEDFDLDSFVASTAPVSIPVDSGVSAVRARKPHRLEYVYVHPEWRCLVYVVPEDFKKRREAHLILPAVAVSYPEICRKVLLVPFCADDNNFYLWPISQEDPNGRLNEFSKSAMQQVSRAIGKWCQFEANLGNQSYNLYEAIEQREAPKWPPGGIQFLIKKAFEDRVIAIKDHPLFRQLRGRKVG
jgi:hypothetical protein